MPYGGYEFISFDVRCDGFLIPRAKIGNVNTVGLESLSHVAAAGDEGGVIEKAELCGVIPSAENSLAVGHVSYLGRTYLLSEHLHVVKLC